jgi:hypothetical protein
MQSLQILVVLLLQFPRTPVHRPAIDRIAFGRQEPSIKLIMMKYYEIENGIAVHMICVSLQKNKSAFDPRNAGEKSAYTEKISKNIQSDKIHVLELYLHALGKNVSDPSGHLQTCQPQSYRTLSTTNNKMGYHINPSNESHPICRHRIGSCQTLLCPYFQLPWCVHSAAQVFLYLGQRVCWWASRGCSECGQRQSP